MLLFATLDRLKADLDDLRPVQAEPEPREQERFELDWNYHANALRGNSLTKDEIEALLVHGVTAARKPLRDHLAVWGHAAAVRGLEEVARGGRPLTEQHIRAAHRALLSQPYEKPGPGRDAPLAEGNQGPGHYKTSSNDWMSAGGKTVYFSSPEDTPARVADLVCWYERETAHPMLHPVALAATLHHRFLRVHPFADGNGRVARLLLNVVLLRYGYGIALLKAEDHDRYLAALAAADAGEPEPFLHLPAAWWRTPAVSAPVPARR